ncbi:helix-turn-helix transcriptional regulator [Microbacterium sp. M3]|uniref:Helix-turn-helix transcriptional regulator n=1 Tax=Microbacterium arthrosphaerae TaxID=792652 RepID=A0ABU4GWA3_9MICO|nr:MULTISPECIES: helix-turn-helix transcriptional regulator [Microbacterium]MDW4571343.1 helix-turn-helix transcriptional regulator [Microbacterium arthrosphaerae]MDW7605198.1 helix-turn-helix transcriptional regulator [Microbacterium sp. M3]
MSPAYLERVLDLDDPDRTEQHLTGVYGPVKMSTGFGVLAQLVVGDDRFQISITRSAGSYGCAGESDQFVIGTSSTPVGWHTGDEDGDLSSAPVLFQPNTRYETFFQPTCNRAVILEPAALAETARVLYGQDDLALAFDGAHPASPRAGATVLSVLDVAENLQRAGRLHDDMVRTTVYRLLAVTALDSFRLVGDPVQRRASIERLARIHREAVDFMHAHASLPITVLDVAAAAGTSVRELTTAFRAREIDQTPPRTYLRNVRLQAAYEDLRLGDPTRGDTVRDISRRWGFLSPSRFAGYFADAYGVSPKQVLDR